MWPAPPWMMRQGWVVGAILEGSGGVVVVNGGGGNCCSVVRLL